MILCLKGISYVYMSFLDKASCTLCSSDATGFPPRNSQLTVFSFVSVGKWWQSVWIIVTIPEAGSICIIGVRHWKKLSERSAWGTVDATQWTTLRCRIAFTISVSISNTDPLLRESISIVFSIPISLWYFTGKLFSLLRWEFACGLAEEALEDWYLPAESCNSTSQ